MNRFGKIMRYIADSSYRFDVNASYGLCKWMNDEKYIKRIFKLMMGYEIDFDATKTFNEKLQWLKLHDRNPEYITMVDKYAAKKWVADRIGEEYIIPTLGVWEHFDDIDFDTLPDQFVLKCTHDSGGLVICTDKSKLDVKAAKKKINKCLKRNFYWVGREWPYKNVAPRILAEPYILDESGVELKDYKIFCFNGKAKYIEVDFNRFVEHKLNTYDFYWNPLNFCDKSKSDYSANIKKPTRLSDMKQIAEKLSKGIRFLRVDFYSIYDQIFVGELTLYPGSGFIQFDPPETDLNLGKILDLEDK